LQPLLSQCSIWYSNASPISSSPAGRGRNADRPDADTPLTRSYEAAPGVRA
jgi:hypothetical protein